MNPHHTISAPRTITRVFSRAALASAAWLAGTTARAEIPAATAHSASAQDVRTAAERQSLIRAATLQGITQVDGTIAEFQAAGLGDSVEVTKLLSLRAALHRLATTDMTAVVTLLGSDVAASGTPAAPLARQARDRQAVILAELSRLLAAFARQQSGHALATAARELESRQQAALQATADLAHASTATPAPSESQMRSAVLTLAAEQLAIATETEALLRAATSLAAGAQQEEESRRATAAIEAARAETLLATLHDATQLLGRRSVLWAAEQQRTGRDGLRHLATRLSPARDRSIELTEAAATLQQHIDDQSALIGQAFTGDGATLDPNRLLTTERLQTELAARVDTTRADLDLLLPSAVPHTISAMRDMHRARPLLLRGDREVETPQRAAITALAAARDELLREATRASAAASAQATPDAAASSQNRADQAQALLAETRALRERLAEATADPRAPGDPASLDALRDRAAQLADRLTASNSAAAEPMRRADAQLRQADPPGDNAPPGDTAPAKASLAEAERRLAREAEQLQSAQRQLAAVEAARDAVDDALASQSRASQTAEDLLRSAAVGKATPAQSKQAAQDQATATSSATRAEAQVATDAPQASPSLRSATDAMRSAQSALSSAPPSTSPTPLEAARQHQDQAERSLTDARRTLSRQAESLRRQLGQPNGPADPLQPARNAVARAQNSARTAEANLSPPGQPGTSSTPQPSPDPSPHPADANTAALAQSAGQLKTSAAIAGDALPATAATAMDRAASQLRESAALARAGQRAAAQQSLQRATRSLTDANDALSEAATAGSSAPGAESPSASANGKGAGQDAPAPAGTSPGQVPPGTGKAASNGSNSAPSANAGTGRGSTASARNDTAPLSPPGGQSRFLALPPRDRAALEQAAADQSPDAYAPLINQYLRNLSQPPQPSSQPPARSPRPPASPQTSQPPEGRAP